MAQSLRQSGPGNASARSNSSLATDLSMVGLTGADQRWMVAHVNQRFLNNFNIPAPLRLRCIFWGIKVAQGPLACRGMW